MAEYIAKGDNHFHSLVLIKINHGQIGDQTGLFYHFFQNNSQIEIVERYKYLGIVFYFNGNLKHAADDLYNKALKAFFSVKSKFNNCQEVPLKTCLKLFDSLSKPILTYGSEIWLSDYNINLNNFDNLPIEKLQHKMLKCILGVKRQSSNMASRL
jgi:hypothetical protein